MSLSPRCHRAPSASVFEFFRERLWRKKIASVALKIREFAPNNGRFFAAANAPVTPRTASAARNIHQHLPTHLAWRAHGKREIEFSFQDPITRCDTNTHTHTCTASPPHPLIVIVERQPTQKKSATKKPINNSAANRSEGEPRNRSAVCVSSCRRLNLWLNRRKRLVRKPPAPATIQRARTSRRQFAQNSTQN